MLVAPFAPAQRQQAEARHVVAAGAHFGLQARGEDQQRRGGKGLQGSDLKSEDFIEHLFTASTHAYILCFTADGRCFWLKVHEIPQAGRAAKGKPIVNLINVAPDTLIAAMVSVKKFTDDEYLLFCTRQGTIKKTALSAFSNPRAGGIIAMGVEDGEFVGKAKAGAEERIELSGFLENIEAAECGEDALTDLAVDTQALGDLQILVGASGFEAEKHVGACVESTKRRIGQGIKRELIPISLNVWHYISGFQKKHPRKCQ